ncbi:putative aminocyclopropanecarboxylate oxidase [Medicago truncatula]|uniref:Putative aminocyclopropanecarboxylate oxidase n=1 Tax=Medicago truncatula TaxID=3880 RepID=A0A396IJW1_MEDTR|nr:putative aminocyclopropanecarboxylate oxidase [Medicago truncatula]
MAMTAKLSLPIIDLSSPDRLSTANSIRQACVEYGFFYLVNHGVNEDFMKQVFEHSAKFFSLPLQHKMNLILVHFPKVNWDLVKRNMVPLLIQIMA